MSLNYSDGLFQGWEVAIAKKYVRQFRTTCQCLERDVFEDLVDECLKHWFFLRDTVRPEEEEKRRAYMVRIVKNKLTDIVRRRRASKCNEYFQAVSLDQFLEDNSDSPFLAHPTQHDPCDEVHLSDLQSKLDQVFKKLNPQQQEVYTAIFDGQLTITEVSLRLNLHRSTVYDEINRIKKIFENEGLRTFLR
jgi:RNA polymerase sigma-70 factor (ECF subfamily)